MLSSRAVTLLFLAFGLSLGCPRESPEPCVPSDAYIGRGECGEGNQTNVLYLRNGVGFGVAWAWYRETDGSEAMTLSCEALLAGDSPVPLAPDDVSFGEPIGTSLVADAFDVGFFFVTCPNTSLSDGEVLSGVGGCLGGYADETRRFVPQEALSGEIFRDDDVVEGQLESEGERDLLDPEGNYLGTEAGTLTLYFRAALCGGPQ